MNYAIIAAGEGSRLAEDGVKQPKPLVKLNGEALIDRLIGIFLKNNAASINIIVNNEMTEVQEHVKKMQLPVPLNLIVKSTPSSMHSFYELRSFLKEGKFCLTTVDTVFQDDEFSGYMDAFIADKENDGLMAVTDFIDDEKPLYVDVDTAMRVKGFYDETNGNFRYISGGIYCLTSRAIQTLENCIGNNMARMRNYQRQLINDQLKLKAYPFKKIVDVDHAGDIQKAESFLLS